MVDGMAQKQRPEERIHPDTKNPLHFYDWFFNNYATEGMKILDTHLVLVAVEFLQISTNLTQDAKLTKNILTNLQKRYNDFVSRKFGCFKALTPNYQ
jgi:hypothetical protein